MLKKIALLIFLISSIYADTLKIDNVKNYPKAILLAKKTQKPIILFIYSNYCPWCDRMKETTLSDKKVINYINDNFIFVMINQNASTLPQKFHCDFVPMTYVVSHEDQEIISELPGYKKADLYIELLEDSLFDE